MKVMKVVMLVIALSAFAVGDIASAGLFRHRGVRRPGVRRIVNVRHARPHVVVRRGHCNSGHCSR